MDITMYADRLRREVAAATELGGPDVAAGAQRLLLALDPAVRLVLLEALSDAAAEISAELPAGSVEARLGGRDLDFVVEVPSELQDAPTVHPEDVSEEPDEPGDQVRITLRLPEGLKVRAEGAAVERGQSLNSWLVEAVHLAASGGGDFRLDLTDDRGRAGSTGARGRARGARRVTGWA